MTKTQLHHWEEFGAAAVLILLLLWILFHNKGVTATPANESTSPTFNISPGTVTVPAISTPDIYLGEPGGDGCCDSCSTCPVTPDTIANVGQMLKIGTAYTNQVIQAGANTVQAIYNIGKMANPQLSATVG